jgi:hypothetical protein
MRKLCIYKEAKLPHIRPLDEVMMMLEHNQDDASAMPEVIANIDVFIACS